MKKLFLFFFLVGSINCLAQRNAPDRNSRDYLRSKALKTEENWFWFSENFDVRPEQFFPEFGKSLGLSSLDSMHFDKAQSDGFDFMIYRFKQYHKGVEVENADYVLEVRNGRIASAHGYLAENANFSYAFSFKEAEALERAKQAVGFKKYAWEVDSLEQYLKKSKADDRATWYPKGQLVFADLNPIGSKLEKYRLTYKFEITAAEDLKSYDIYVDAITGEVVKRTPKERNCTAHSHQPKMAGSRALAKPLILGTGYLTPLHSGRYGSMWSMTHSYNDSGAGNYFYLYDNSRGAINTRNWSTPNTAILRMGYDPNWYTTNNNATTLHAIIQRSYDYFQSTFFRNGMSGSNNAVTGYVSWNAVDNAQYTNIGGLDVIQCGTTFFGDPVVSLDIVGHEYTHGLIRYTSNLAYRGLSGALNESFADMLGTKIEHQVLGTNNYLLGEDVFWGGIRDMQNPNNFLQPATVGGTFWQDPTGCVPVCDSNDPNYNDCCFVHTNSGVPNRWFFLVATRPDPLPQIGNAGFIAYQTLIRLSANSNFNDARNASIDVANYYYGGNCNQVARDVTNAWAAVGVGATTTCPARIAATESAEPSKGYPIVYPNPVSDVLIVQLKEEESDFINPELNEKIFTLYNAEGRRVVENRSKTKTCSLDVKQLPSGMYILQVTSGSENKQTLVMKQQVIVMH